MFPLSYTWMMTLIRPDPSYKPAWNELPISLEGLASKQVLQTDSPEEAQTFLQTTLLMGII